MTFRPHKFLTTFPTAVCAYCGITREQWAEGQHAHFSCPGAPETEQPVPGQCPYCGAYIGVAVAHHARYCEMRASGS